MARILLICSPYLQMQGYGDQYATQCIKESLEVEAKQVKVIRPSKLEEIKTEAHDFKADLIWSNLYFINHDNLPTGKLFAKPDQYREVHSYLEEIGFPHVGPTASAFRILAHKGLTREHLHAKHIAVPQQQLALLHSTIPTIPFPAFVKPLWEAESKGISEKSVVHNEAELAEAIHQVWTNFEQAAVVEEYLPGDEYTVMILGNGNDVECIGLKMHFHRSSYDKYPLITPNLKDGGASYILLEGEEEKEIAGLALHATHALNAYDHIRVDIRRDAQGIAKIIDVNGIPGLQPNRSRALAMYSMKYPDYSTSEIHRRLVNRVVDGALRRNGVRHL